MLPSNLRTVTAALLLVGAVGIAASELIYPAQAAEPPKLTELGGDSQPREKPKKRVLRFDAVLEGVDAKQRTITVTTGRAVDAVLREKEEGGWKWPRDEGEKQTLPVTGTAGITIEFRMRVVSSANHLPRSLTELERMVGSPVSLEVTAEGDQIVVTRIVAWRGTPKYENLLSPREMKEILEKIEKLEKEGLRDGFRGGGGIRP